MRSSWHCIWRHLDVGSEGFLTPLQFHARLEGRGLTEAEVDELFFQLDGDCDGVVSEEEFIQAFQLIFGGLGGDDDDDYLLTAAPMSGCPSASSSNLPSNSSNSSSNPSSAQQAPPPQVRTAGGSSRNGSACQPPLPRILSEDGMEIMSSEDSSSSLEGPSPPTTPQRVAGNEGCGASPPKMVSAKSINALQRLLDDDASR